VITLAPDGTVHQVAGVGSRVPTGETQAANQVGLACSGLAAAPNGDLYVATHNMIRKLRP
jgi:hypothetical protein